MNWEQIAKKLGYSNFRSMFITLYQVEKLPLAKIASELGCSTATIRRQVELHGLAEYLRGKGKVTPFLTEAELTGTIDEAAERTGLSRSTIWYRRKRSAEILKEMARVMDLPITESETVRRRETPEVPDVDP